MLSTSFKLEILILKLKQCIKPIHRHLHGAVSNCSWSFEKIDKRVFIMNHLILGSIHSFWCYIKEFWSLFHTFSQDGWYSEGTYDYHGTRIDDTRIYSDTEYYSNNTTSTTRRPRKGTKPWLNRLFNIFCIFLRIFVHFFPSFMLTLYTKSTYIQLHNKK